MLTPLTGQQLIQAILDMPPPPPHPCPDCEMLITGRDPCEFCDKDKRGVRYHAPIIVQRGQTFETTAGHHHQGGLVKRASAVTISSGYAKDPLASTSLR